MRTKKSKGLIRKPTKRRHLKSKSRPKRRQTTKKNTNTKNIRKTKKIRMNKKFGRGKKRFTRNWKMKIGGDFQKGDFQNYNLDKAVRKYSEFMECANNIDDIDENEKEKLFNCLEEYNNDNKQTHNNKQTHDNIKEDIFSKFTKDTIADLKQNPEKYKDLIESIKEDKEKEDKRKRDEAWIIRVNKKKDDEQKEKDIKELQKLKDEYNNLKKLIDQLEIKLNIP